MNELRITIKCGRCQQTFWTLTSPKVIIIEEKYPFWCDHCGQTTTGIKWPWMMTAEIVE